MKKIDDEEAFCALYRLGRAMYHMLEHVESILLWLGERDVSFFYNSERKGWRSV